MTQKNAGKKITCISSDRLVRVSAGWPGTGIVLQPVFCIKNCQWYVRHWPICRRLVSASYGTTYSRHDSTQTAPYAEHAQTENLLYCQHNGYKLTRHSTRHLYKKQTGFVDTKHEMLRLPGQVSRAGAAENPQNIVAPYNSVSSNLNSVPSYSYQCGPRL